MDLESAILALAAAAAWFIVTAAVVSELLRPIIEFSVFVGIPAGLLVALLAGAATYRRLGGPAATRWQGVALGAFGVGFLVVGAGAAVAGLRPSRALQLGVAAGVAAAAVTGLRSRNRRPARAEP